MATKKNVKTDRRAVVEQMRKEQQRKERTRSMVILGVSVAVVLGLLALAVVPYVRDAQRRHKLQAASVSSLGVTPSAAGCQAIKTANAQGSGQHKAEGTTIKYSTAPPAYGPHWGNFLQGPEIKNFYNTEDRPPIERLVHSLEHGHTILWYDDTVKPGTKAYRDIEQIAGKFASDAYFMSAPWHTKDGGAFPSGTHIALTHWTGPQNQKGVWEYCAQPSGSVVKSFLGKYPPTNAPEPGSA